MTAVYRMQPVAANYFALWRANPTTRGLASLRRFIRIRTVRRMQAYLLALLALLILGIIAHNAILVRGAQPDALLGFVCLMFFVISALRASSVGADTANYEHLSAWVAQFGFFQVGSASSSVWYLNGSDLGYRFFAKAVSMVSTSPRAITVVNSAIVNAALYVFIKRQSPDRWLSCFLFFTLGLFQLSMNLAPFFMAIMIVSCGYEHAVSGRFWRYACYVLAGSLFHPAVIVMILLYPLPRIKITGRRFICVLACSTIVAIFFYPHLLSVIKGVVPARYMVYFTTEVVTLEKMAVWVLHLAIFGVCWAFQANRAEMFEENRLVCWMFLLESVFYLFSSQSTGLGRVAYMFTPYLVVAIPMLLQSVKRKEGASFQARDLVSATTDIDQKGALTTLSSSKTLVVALCLAAYLLRLSVNNIGQTIPYAFFWSM